MRNNAHASPDDIDPVQVFAAIKRNLVKLILASLLVGLMTYVALTIMTPRYTSVAQLQFGGRALISSPSIEQAQRNGQTQDVLVKVDKESVASQVQIIKSEALVLKVIEDLKLDRMAEFNSDIVGNGISGFLMRTVGLGGGDTGDSARDKVLAKVYDRLKVYQGKDTRVVSIRFTASSPKRAALIANHLADVYLKSRATQGVKQSVDVTKKLLPEIEKLQAEVQAAEAKAGDYRAQNNLFAGSQGNSRGTLNNERLSGLTTELTRAQTQKSEADARAEGIRDLMRLGSGDASPDVIRSPLIQRLQDQRVRVERQISELSATLLPAHPRMRQLRADLFGLNRQIRGEVAKIADSLAREAKVAGLRVASIQASIDVLKSQVRSSGGSIATLNQLESQAKVKRQQLESLQSRYQLALARQRTQAIPLEAELFSKARGSTIPTFPKKGPVTLLAMAATFLLGLAFVVTKELLVGSRSGGGSPNRGRRSTDRYEPAATAAGPSLAATPAMAAGAGVAATAAVAEPAVTATMPEISSVERFATVTSIDSVSSHIGTCGQGQTGYRTLIAGDDVGVTAAGEAIDVAMKLTSQGGQVVLVDWCPEGRGIAASIDLEGAPGMSELLAGTASFEDVICRLADGRTHFIAAGAGMGPDGSSDADRVNLVLDALDEAYDHIIVHGDHNAARDLFLTIQGRFDAGVTVSEVGGRISVLEVPDGTFLGFEVSDLTIIRFERSMAAAIRPGAGRMPVSAGAGN